MIGVIERNVKHFNLCASEFIPFSLILSAIKMVDIGCLCQIFENKQLLLEQNKIKADNLIIYICKICKHLFTPIKICNVNMSFSLLSDAKYLKIKPVDIPFLFVQFTDLL